MSPEGSGLPSASWAAYFPAEQCCSHPCGATPITARNSIHHTDIFTWLWHSCFPGLSPSQSEADCIVIFCLFFSSQCRGSRLDPWSRNQIPHATVKTEDPTCHNGDPKTNK